MFSASAIKGKRVPIGITLGVMTSFAVFTILIAYIEKFLHINSNFFRVIAVSIIILLGLCMIVPSFGVRLEIFFNFILSPFRNKIKSQSTGFFGGYVMGFATGLIWAPCSGPILATVATLAAIQAVNVKVVL
ncbi:MAG: cytochrome c biogenesis protein CcdA, partial [Candidatus Omnitrophica bacterium]|nr:cytochrome c biogenesis protein CcdA [Candidatus Omnitrophota bacterium]